MQELVVYTGHLESYENGHEIIQKYLGVEVSDTQIYRLTDLYGKEIGKEKEQTAASLTPLKKDEMLIVEVDGGMILTRKEKTKPEVKNDAKSEVKEEIKEDWKEVKLGRIFKSGDCIRPDGKQGFITHSQYIAHLGGSKMFSSQMETLLESYQLPDKRMIFLSDGAPWIKNWIEDAFPGAVSILDYFHAVEHLYGFSGQYFKNEQQGKVWAKDQQELLLESGVATVIQNIEKLKQNKETEKLLNYYKNNEDRMDYKKYKAIGCGIIGSGAIESAHRTVVQKRMKQAGQRWGRRGAQNMLNLRVVSMNKRWDKVVELTKRDFKAAA